MKSLLEVQKVEYSKLTIHKYMKELELKSIVTKKKQAYVKGTAHKVFPNLLKRDFTSLCINKKWCTDFTYLFLKNGAKRYNCTIIDLHDRSVVASLNGKNITANLAIQTLKLAFKNNRITENLILHSDQGSQFTSQEFTDFCLKYNITQSMSKSGCPYDNAPMESFYGTFKNEHTHHLCFTSDEMLNETTNDYMFHWYNHIRPHSFNNGKTPFAARYD
jgi:transposase InsO family protein